MALISVILFLVPIAIFTNLHVVHSYYQAASAIFLICAASFLISEVAVAGQRGLALILTLTLVLGCFTRFFQEQWPLANAKVNNPFYTAARIVEKNTVPNSALIIVGADWSSEAHYYARRKGVALPGWTTLDQANKLFNQPDAMMGGLVTGAVVDCRPASAPYSAAIDAAVNDFVRSWAAQSSRLSAPPAPGVCDVYVRADKS